MNIPDPSPYPLDDWLFRLREHLPPADEMAVYEQRLLRNAGDRRLLLFNRILSVSGSDERVACLRQITQELANPSNINRGK